VKRTYAELLATAEKAAPKAQIDGVLVCEMVIGGVETVVGVSQDELFGPTVMVGLGGVLVEIFEYVAIRVPPFGKDEAKRMVTGLKGLPLLQGARGAKKADINALVDVIMKVQRLAVDHSDTISELDINPLVVLPKGAKALDALIVTR
jgi:acyl-CoA synthetase (NDP forming)